MSLQSEHPVYGFIESSPEKTCRYINRQSERKIGNYKQGWIDDINRDRQVDRLHMNE